MDNLYVEIFSCDNNSKQIEVSLETLITLFVYKHCESTFKLNLVLQENLGKEPAFTVNIRDECYSVILKDELPLLAAYCVLPVAIVNKVTVISGLCSVARQIIKCTPSEHTSRKLLGFREACLMACNESSIWTKFCEIDMIHSVKQLLQNSDLHFTDKNINIPKDLTRFECHMSQPVRIHNVYKVAQDLAKLNNKDSSDINSTIPKEKLELQHLYGEGPYMTLADIILYPLIHIMYVIFGNEIFQNNLPLTLEWYKNMTIETNLNDINIPVDLSLLTVKGKEVIQENIQKQSLYVSDPQRYKPRNRIFTKQPDIINALNIVQSLNVNVKVDKPFGYEIDFDWAKIPLQANPEGGALPKSRMKRKCEQLENLAKAVMKIAKPDQVIIDFCSGSGHLGILLAVKLPKCKIILLENKEMSLARARERIEKLNLDNVILLQCNLDYFIGQFDIGVSLHACGVATDLVIQHCLRRNAAFVSCPCCYGGVHVCHHITYPRSQMFNDSSLTLRDYLVLGHAADQTHDAENAKTKQGIECMNIIDTDRKMQAEELGYEVTLSKMIPESCTPKNNILVGLPKI